MATTNFQAFSGDVEVASNLQVGTANLFVDITTGHVGIGKTNPTQLLDIAGNVAANVNTLFVDTVTSRVGIGTSNPSAPLEVSGNVTVGSTLTVSGFRITAAAAATDDLQAITNAGADTTNQIHITNATRAISSSTGALRVGDSGAPGGIGVVGNVYVGDTVTTQDLSVDNVISDFAVNTDDFFVDISESKVGVSTTQPHAELHVVGNVYVSSNLTVDADTLHVDAANDRVGVNTKNPEASLHLVGNAYVSGDVEMSSNVLMSSNVFIKGPGPTSNVVAIGIGAGYTTQGIDSVAIGTDAGKTSQGSHSVAVGLNAGITTQATRSVAVGFGAGQSNQASNSTAIGYNSGKYNQGSNAVAVGVGAGETSQGVTTVAVGNLAGYTGQLINAIAIGNAAGRNNQDETCIAIGLHAGSDNQEVGAIAMGNGAGTNGTQGSYSVAIGVLAGNTSQSSYAVAIGRDTARYNQGSEAVAIGYLAGSDSQGASAVAIGPQCGRVTQAPDALAIGFNAGSRNQGNQGVAIGSRAGESNQGSGAIAIGRLAGRYNQGTYSVAIGFSVGANFNQPANTTYFRHGSIRNVNGSEYLHITNNGEFVRGNNYSDDRLKYDEKFITGAIKSLFKLRPQEYLKKPKLIPDPDHDEEWIHESGLMAQEVYYSAPELRHLVRVSETAGDIDTLTPAPSDDPSQDPDYSVWGDKPSGIKYIQFIPYLIKGIQEIVTELPRSKTTVSNTWDQNITGLVVSADTNTHKTNTTPIVTLSNVYMDKKWYGVVSDQKTDTNDYDTLVDTKGDTSIWVTDMGGPLESGDLLTTSNVALGHTQKQVDDLIRSSTVAKVTQDCDFTEPTQHAIRVPKRELSNVKYYVKSITRGMELSEYELYNNIHTSVETTPMYIYEVQEEENSNRTRFYSGGVEVGDLTGKEDPTTKYFMEKTPDEYENLDDEEKAKYTLGTRNVYKLHSHTRSSRPIPEHEEEVFVEELVDVLDENGQIVWEDTANTAPAYTLVDHGTHKAALLTCKLY
jgi:hypothetical protein